MMRRRGMDPVRAGAIALVLLSVGLYFGFTKRVPLRHHFTIHAVLKSTNLVAPGSPVRIAGVNVGKVTSVGRYKDTDLAEIAMQIDGAGLPIHKDAELKIRPRLFLEGNFYVDLRPGTPTAPDLSDGDLIPVTQTATPVQIDQVLTALQSNTRGNLQQALQGLGAGFGGAPTAADDAAQDPIVRGLTGGQALNRALTTGPQALHGVAKVSRGLLGTQPHDLSKLIDGFAKATTALADREGDLRDLVGHFDTTMATFADNTASVEATVAQLGPTARSADGAFTRLSGGLPPLRRFVADLSRGVPEIPATIAAADPWLVQSRALLGRPELGGLLDELRPATEDLARLGAATREWLPEIDKFNRCMTKVFIPTGNVKVDDGGPAVENYKEFWYAMVGQNGEGQGFDGNGSFLRIAAAGGGTTVETGNTNYGTDPKHPHDAGNTGPLFGNTIAQPTGTRPAFPNKLPPLNRSTPCYLQPVPDVNGPDSHGPADGSKPDAPAPEAPPATKDQTVAGRKAIVP